MLRKNFESEIHRLKDEILDFGGMVEKNLLDSVDALKRRDVGKSHKVVEVDKVINKKRFELENEVMILIATQQPMAKDLRLLASFFEVISEIERMGDYAKGIGTINIRMGSDDLLKPLIDIPIMAEKSADMCHRALIAFINEDVDAALLIPKEDDEIDALYIKVYRDLIAYVVSDPESIEKANWLLWVAHNLERFADRVTNICERTAFVVNGKLFEIEDNL
jgi:phosphate transport system protein